ncbi:hypothetical protein MKZ38_008437 [Zalerion maritima]|uniref:Hydroxyproline-rich glyco protein n=1 Tax=Zalerion maritima TaxID=339359 RepID=A0AAD5RH07_9PEZI|nr:hypothetical protein MKZ38_008437 [Zalerion maritima]
MDQAASPPADEPAEASQLPSVSDIDPKGDVILDVVFETSKDTLKLARKEAKFSRTPVTENLKPRTRFAYRVQINILRKQSKYFDSLLGNTQFQEARIVTDKLSKLSLANVKPAEADPSELPWVRIEDDDEATRVAGRNRVLADLLRILHGKDIATKPVNMSFVTTLAVLADRFDCAATVSRCLSTKLKFKWPATHQAKTPRTEEGGRLSEAAEGLLRQKVLTAWLLDQPPRMATATRELLIRGSRQWSLFNAPETDDKPIWWDLQDDLENELRSRRECIMNTMSSILRHFLTLYTSRGTQQCKLGYDSSAACDSYQLGEMIRFFTNKNLLHLTDFGPASAYNIPDSCQLNVEEMIATLRQFPGYQIDNHHTNCGLRIRLMPILEYIQTMLSASAVAISSTAWKKERKTTAWSDEVNEFEDDRHDGDDGKQKTFKFTRSVAGDQRLRYEGAMAAEKMARELFTAEDWDWTPDDNVSSSSSFPGEFRPLGFKQDRTRR